MRLVQLLGSLGRFERKGIRTRDRGPGRAGGPTRRSCQVPGVLRADPGWPLRSLQRGREGDLEPNPYKAERLLPAHVKNVNIKYNNYIKKHVFLFL